MTIQPPFPWYGGKRRVAQLVWDRFGDVRAYCEPFLGAGAVFLGRPDPRGMETINDLDCLVVNFWRSMQENPGLVIRSFKGLLSEVDFRAKKAAVMRATDCLEQLLVEDPRYCDPELASWWAFCVCLSVGEFGPETSGRIHLGRWSGVLALHQADTLREYLEILHRRLEGVRILCGDWARAVGSAATTFHGDLVAVFFDPPYGVRGRARCYRLDDRNLSQKVSNWCREHGTDRRFRIALCGYEGEYDLPGWDVVAWKANGGQGSQDGRGQKNRELERIWFSPHCLGNSLFSEAGAA